MFPVVRGGKVSKPETFLELFGKQRAKHSNLDPSDSLIYKKIAKTMIITIMLAFPIETDFWLNIT